MNRCIMVIGDLHCRLNYLNDFKDLSEKILDAICKNNPENVIFLGDLLHNHANIHTATYNEVCKLLNQASLYANTIVLIGNHDYVNCSQYCTQEHPFNALKHWRRITIVDKPTLIPIYDHTNIIACPYVPKGKFVTALNEFVPSYWKHADAIFAHQEFLGANTGTYISPDGDAWSDSYPHVISGHIHTRSTIGRKIRYIGTPMQTNFGEPDDVSISLFDMDWNEKRLFLDIKKRITLNINTKDFDNIIIPDNAHVRVELVGSVQELTAIKKTKKYQDLVILGVKVVPRVTNQDVVKKTNNVNYFQALQSKVDLEDETVKLLFKDIIKTRTNT